MHWQEDFKVLKQRRFFALLKVDMVLRDTAGLLLAQHGCASICICRTFFYELQKPVISPVPVGPGLLCIALSLLTFRKSVELTGDKRSSCFFF